MSNDDVDSITQHTQTQKQSLADNRHFVTQRWNTKAVHMKDSSVYWAELETVFMKSPPCWASRCKDEICILPPVFVLVLLYKNKYNIIIFILVLLYNNNHHFCSGLSGNRIQWGAIFRVHSDHPLGLLSFRWHGYLVFFTRVKRPESGFDRIPHLGSRLKKVYSCNSIPSLGLHGLL